MTVTSLDILLVVGAVSYVYILWRRRVLLSTKRQLTSRVQADHGTAKFAVSGSMEVSQIFIHPIKSCRGTSVQQAEYTPGGLKYDRRFAIIDATTHKVITAREISHMVLVNPQLVQDPSASNGGRLVVTFPPDSGGAEFTVPLCPDQNTLKSWDILNDVELWGKDVDGYICPGAANATLSRFLQRDVLLVYKGPRARPCPPTYAFPHLDASAAYQDAYPLLVANDASLGAVEERVRDFAERGEKGVDPRWGKEKLAIERFRPNIVIHGANPWAEDDWEEIEVGGCVTITLVSKCTRCLLPNVDTKTGKRDAAVPHKVLMSFRTGLDPARMTKACFGCNGVPHGSGSIRVGDSVRVTHATSVA
ncbi:hypothetical protein BD410DRAFT_727313 [Rickenella mellea]|uniref:MOSC domain-containing protein n=1 Tax=Rickenella mellea TaxID=50990 RepID=A0A4Y7PXX3_9AGAM|nr:hypothetical protein BD410DRAFT_727313 [Rickenella mellea]